MTTEQKNSTMTAGNDEIHGIYHAAKDAEEGFYPVPYHYQSSYFADNSQYQPGLASMSLILAMSGFSYFPENHKVKDNEYYLYQHNNISYLMTGRTVDPSFVKYDELKPLGFESFYVNQYYKQHSEYDSIGVAMGHRKISTPDGDESLVAVCVRGGGYESEWGGNVTVMPTKDRNHKGFQLASDKVVEELAAYLQENQNYLSQKNVKLWIVGYSRAAATANLAAATIIDRIMDGESSDVFRHIFKRNDNVFAYTFETPAGVELYPDTSLDNRYRTIHNVINVNDLVTKVAPADWSFGRRGSDMVLPHKVNTSFYDDDIKRMKACMRVYLNIKNPEKFYLIDKFNNNNLTMDVFLDWLFTRICENVLIKENYENQYQNHLRILAGFCLDGRNEKALNKIFSEDNFMAYMYWLMFSKEYFVKKSAELIFKILNKLQYKCDKKTIDGIMGVIYDIAWNLYKMSTFNLIWTIWNNQESLAQGHYTAICMAWLMSKDNEHYPVNVSARQTEDGADRVIDGSYRVVYIAAPVDVLVQNSLGETMVEINDGISPVNSQEIEFEDKSYKGTSVYELDENGQTVLYLPPDETYTITLTGTDSGSVDYVVTEYNPLKGGVQNVAAYHSAPGSSEIREGEVYSLILHKKQPEETAVRCTLTKTEAGCGDKMFKMEALTEKAPYVSVRLNDMGPGISFGQYSRIRGTLAKLTARPFNGAKFMGWYDESGNLLSGKNVYCLRADDDIILTAKFSEKETV